MFLLHTEKITDENKNDILQKINKQDDVNVTSFNSIISDIYHIVDGETGKIIPCVEFKDIFIYGTNKIKSLPITNNVFIYNKLKIGDTISIDFMNENTNELDLVFLYYIDDVSEMNEDSKQELYLTNCPSCGSTIYIENETMYCRNPECPAQIQHRCEHFNNCIGIKFHGIYSLMLNILISRYLIKSPTDIFCIVDVVDKDNKLNKLKSYLNEGYSNDQLLVFYNLINSVVGKVDMYQLFKGLKLNISDEHILDYVKYEIEYFKTNYDNKMFNIQNFIDEITQFRNKCLNNNTKFDNEYQYVIGTSSVIPGLTNSEETSELLLFEEIYREKLKYLDKLKLIGSAFTY